jgi:thiamine transport system substrate-binding protein
MVLSYTTSPAYHIIAEKNERYQAAEFSEGHPIQVEVAAMTKTENAELARSFLKFMISPAFQDIIPESNWMMPVAKTSTPLNPVFDTLVHPAITLSMAPDEAAKARKAYIDEWLAATSGQ